MKSNKTTIQISIETRERLKVLGKKGDSYNYIIGGLLDKGEEMSEEAFYTNPHYPDRLIGSESG